MSVPLSAAVGTQSRLGRPRRGTEAARTDVLICAATQLFLREGYRSASIDKVAFEAGVSTRTIYERFKNKAELLGAVITRLVDRDMEAVRATTESLSPLEPRAALTAIGRAVTDRVCDPDSSALFRILATEAPRFPELADKMRCAHKERINDAIAGYFRIQMGRGTLRLSDPDRAASLFMQMVCGQLHECLLFGSPDEMSSLDLVAHLDSVIEIFLNGAVPRGAQ